MSELLFAYTNKKDYIDWLNEATTDETRNKRLATYSNGLQRVSHATENIPAKNGNYILFM